MKTINEAPIAKGVKVLVRCDLDVSINKEGIIEDTYRLDAALPTLNYIIEKGGFPTICGHMGRPGGKYVADLSTTRLTPYFDDRLHSGTYKLIENLRFDPKEEENNITFAKSLAKDQDIFVNESFATCHRTAASIVGITTILPSYCGFRLAEEIVTLNKLMKSPKRPFVAVIGGGKIESKKPVINKFLTIADMVCVGGKLALEERKEHEKILNPLDYVDNKDIGPKTLELWHDVVKEAKTIVWAGPVGVFEEDIYSIGTSKLLEFFGEAKKNGCFIVAGGGDTISAITKFKAITIFNFISTGGSAMLDFIAYGSLPGIDALNR